MAPLCSLVERCDRANYPAAWLGNRRQLGQSAWEVCPILFAAERGAVREVERPAVKNKHPVVSNRKSRTPLCPCYECVSELDNAAGQLPASESTREKQLGLI